MYGTYMAGTATRGGGAGTITTATLKSTHGFGVMAYQTSADINSPIDSKPNFMYNQKIQWDNTKGYWYYTPVKYWPNGTTEDDNKVDEANTNGPSNTALSTNDDRVSFFAYAPWVEVSNNGGSSPNYSSSAEKTLDGRKAFLEAAVTTEGENISNLGNGIVALKSNDVAAAPEVKYYMPTATSTQAVDLIWGLRGSKSYSETDANNNTITTLGSSYNINLTKQIVSETVDFMFKHALSKIGGSTSKTTSTKGVQQCGFKVVVDVDANGSGINGIDNQANYLGSNFSAAKTLVTLNSVKIQDGLSAYNDRTNNALPNEALASDLKNTGWFNLATGTWSNVAIIDKTNTTTTAGATYNISAVPTGTDVWLLDPDIKENGVTNNTGADWQKANSGDQGYTGGAEGVTTTAKNVYADGQDVPALMLIPGTEKQTLYVTVDYFVRTADPHLSTGYSEVRQVVTNKVELNNLNANKYYTLVMHLGLTSVKFSAIVTDWTATDDPTYTESGVTEGGVTAAEEVWLPSNVIAYTSSTTPALGTSSNVNVKASDQAYTVNLTGLSTTDKLEITGSTGLSIPTVNETAYSENMTTPSATPAIHVSFAKNITDAAKSYALTIKQKNSEGTLLTTTTVNIVQPAFAFVLSASAGVVTVKDADNNNLEFNTDYTVVVKDSEGTTLSSAASTSATEYAVSGQTVTLPTAAGTYTVTVTHKTTTSIKKTIVVTKQ